MVTVLPATVLLNHFWFPKTLLTPLSLVPLLILPVTTDTVPSPSCWILTVMEDFQREVTPELSVEW